MIKSARQRLGVFESNELMINAGLYTPGTNLEIDAAIDIWPKLDAFVGASECKDISVSFQRLKDCLEPAQQIQLPPD